MSDKKVRVTIDDMNFFVVGNDNEDYIKDLANNLDDRIKATSKSNYRLNQVQTLVLTALNILDELETLKEDRNLLASASEDEEVLAKTIEKSKKLERELENKSADFEKAKNAYLELQNRSKSTEEELRKTQRSLVQEKQNSTDLKTDLEKSKKQIEALNTQNYESQKKIIDLSRELESLYDQ
ncbi:MAG: cell division protein ZapA [Tissierellia bacterium]|nr:cell division protein ZapA [Tissierellia bacterium]